MDGDMDMDMSMTFQPFSSYQLKVIWDWWDVQTKGQYAATLLALFLAVIFYRYLVRVELELVRKNVVLGGVAGSAELGESLITGPGSMRGGGGTATFLLNRLPWGQRLAHALLSGLLYAYALLLMLAAMAYNPGVFLALVCGYIAGEFAFGTSLAAGGVGATHAKGSACCD